MPKRLTGPLHPILLVTYALILAALLIYGGLTGVVTAWLLVQVQFVGVRFHLLLVRHQEAYGGDAPALGLRPDRVFVIEMLLSVLGTLYGGGALLAERWAIGVPLILLGISGTVAAWHRVPRITR